MIKIDVVYVLYIQKQTPDPTGTCHTDIWTVIIRSSWHEFLRRFFSGIVNKWFVQGISSKAVKSENENGYFAETTSKKRLYTDMDVYNILQFPLKILQKTSYNQSEYFRILIKRRRTRTFQRNPEVWWHWRRWGLAKVTNKGEHIHIKGSKDVHQIAVDCHQLMTSRIDVRWNEDSCKYNTESRQPKVSGPHKSRKWIM